MKKEFKEGDFSEIHYCIGHQKFHLLCEFSLFIKTGRYLNQCKKFISIRKKEKYEINKKEILEINKIYSEKNKIHISEQRKIVYLLNKDFNQEKSRIFYKENREEILLKKVVYGKNNRKKINSQRKERLKTDPNYKIRMKITTSINKALKRNNGSKKGGSILDYISFSINDMKLYFEKIFNLSGNEWMNWENHGMYNTKTWADDDKSTWKWQIDHIIPHSDLPYDTMDHPNFQKAWALENLRPLSAKQNHTDGVRRTRHKKK